MRCLRTLLFVLTFACAARLPAGATVGAAQAFPAVAAPHPLALDPSLGDAAWQAGAIPSAGAFENITTRRPALFSTSVSLLYDTQNLYVGFVADQGTTPIAATQTTNDVGYGSDDFVGIAIDTSGNGSQVYFFEATPRGVRYQQANENSRYRPDWQAAGKITGGKYSVMMIIPFKVLRIGAGAVQSFKFNFFRNVAATGEHYTWAYDGVMNDGPVGQWPVDRDARFWPTITGLKISGAAALRPKPHADIYALSSNGTDRKLFAQANGAFVPQDIRNAGIDFTVPLTTKINFVGTANPDFSNVEIDQQTIAPQEFRRNLQEYRPFFAQGANYFQPNYLPFGSFSEPQYTTFYSPNIGPFDRGEKIEGTFGNQSIGLMNFRGYDATSQNAIDDIAYGYRHSIPDQTFQYWVDGVAAHHSIAGHDATTEFGFLNRNLKTGLFESIDYSTENGNTTGANASAHLFNAFSFVHKTNYQAVAGYADVSPTFNPLDGFTVDADVRGPYIQAELNGGTPGIKNWNVSAYADRFMDRTGAVHQADTYLTANATLNNGWSLNNVGPTVGILRRYATDDPAKYAGACNDPSLPYTTFTGFPTYTCARSDRYNLLNFGLGYHDGTPAPVDFNFNEGPFGSQFLHLYALTTSRPLGNRFSVGLEYDGTYERDLGTSHLDSQWLRRVTVGETIDQNSNVSFSLRGINGNGGFAIPGLNLAASYHRRFQSGDLYVNYGTPSANTTLNRWILKYVFHVGGVSGT